MNRHLLNNISKQISMNKNGWAQVLIRLGELVKERQAGRRKAGMESQMAFAFESNDGYIFISCYFLSHKLTEDLPTSSCRLLKSVSDTNMTTLFPHIFHVIVGISSFIQISIEFPARLRQLIYRDLSNSVILIDFSALFWCTKFAALPISVRVW